MELDQGTQGKDEEGKNKKKVQVRKWNAVAFWSFGMNSER